MVDIAFKVTYNDGGANGGLIGYRGVCSDRIIVDNVKVREMTWCSAEENPCRLYCDSGLNGRRPIVRQADQAHCYESGLLFERPLRFWAGVFHNGPREGEPQRIRQVEPGDIAFLTTIPPGGEQEDRIVFGCYRVGRVTPTDSGDRVESDGTMDVVVPDDVARDFYFWNFQPPNRDGTRRWGFGLFRYLYEADITQRLIEDLMWRLGDDRQRDVIIRALGDEFGPKPNPTPHLHPNGHGHRGQGSGESDEHRNLKNLVAECPERIGLPRKATPAVEHRFLSGDRVDVKFDLPDGTAAVVEVETICPRPGAHQAVKYRALLEVERGDKLGADKVQAVLVAHRFDEETRDLARRYNISLVTLQA